MLKLNNPYTILEGGIENLELADWAWNSHYWVEGYSGYYQCKYCGNTFTSTMGITVDTPLCEKNPILMKYKNTQ